MFKISYLSKSGHNDMRNLQIAWLCVSICCVRLGVHGSEILVGGLQSWNMGLTYDQVNASIGDILVTSRFLCLLRRTLWNTFPDLVVVRKASIFLEYISCPCCLFKGVISYICLIKASQGPCMRVHLACHDRMLKRHDATGRTVIGD